MERYRVGEYNSLVMDIGYVIQKKVWWGWKNWCIYESAAAARHDAKKLEDMGHFVHWYI